MAEHSKTGSTKKRQLKKTETVRERSERVVAEPGKQRRIKRTATTAAKPFKVVGKKTAKVLSPLGFLLAPFKTKPARKIGRFLGRALLLKFFREAWAELKQVQWPTARETTRLTIAVFIFSILFGTIVAITDYGLDKVFKKVFID